MTARSNRTFKAGHTRHADCDCCEHAATRIVDLEDAMDLRNAATKALCIAIHGEVLDGKSIYDLVHDAAALRVQAKSKGA